MISLFMVFILNVGTPVQTTIIYNKEGFKTFEECEAYADGIISNVGGDNALDVACTLDSIEL